MTEAAKKLTKEDGSQYGMALRNDNNQAGYYNMIYDNGGSIISDDKKKSGWDDPKTIEAMQMFILLLQLLQPANLCCIYDLLRRIR